MRSAPAIRIMPTYGPNLMITPVGEMESKELVNYPLLRDYRLLK